MDGSHIEEALLAFFWTTTHAIRLEVMNTFIVQLIRGYCFISRGEGWRNPLFSVPLIAQPKTQTYIVTSTSY